MRAVSMWAMGIAAGIAVLMSSVGKARAAQGGQAPAKPPSKPSKPKEPKEPMPAPKPSQYPPDGGPGFPNDPTARSAYILGAVLAGDASHAWAPVDLAAGGLLGRIDVSADDLRVHGIRVNADARTLQAIADALGGVLATSRVVDAVYAQAARTTAPITTSWYADKPTTMNDTNRMLEYSGMVDAKLGDDSSLAANTGKWWVLAKPLWAKPGYAANYGWHSSAGKVIQPVGLAHDWTHSDYSQKVRVMRDTMDVSRDGGSTWETMSTHDVLVDPELAPLLSAEGALPGSRIPGL